MQKSFAIQLAAVYLPHQNTHTMNTTTTTTTLVYAKNKVTGEVHPVVYTCDQWGNPRRIVDGKTYYGNKQFDRTFTMMCKS